MERTSYKFKDLFKPVYIDTVDLSKRNSNIPYKCDKGWGRKEETSFSSFYSSSRIWCKYHHSQLDASSLACKSVQTLSSRRFEVQRRSLDPAGCRAPSLGVSMQKEVQRWKNLAIVLQESLCQSCQRWHCFCPNSKQLHSHDPGSNIQTGSMTSDGMKVAVVILHADVL